MKSTVFIILGLSLLTTAQEPRPASFEDRVLLHAPELLPTELLKGKNHRVRDLVPTDGYMAHFEIDSDYGTFTATGLPDAKQRIAEIEAIGRLVETSRGDLFAEGLKRSVEQPIDAVKNIVEHPVDSVKRAPRTVGHFFTRIGTSISREVTRIEDRETSHDEPSSAEIGRGIGEAAKSVAGFEKARLDTAKQLGMDPYSDNPRLQEEIEKVTWAFFAGGLPLRIGAMAASAGLAVTATHMVGIPEDTYSLTRAELALRDQRSLEAMGVEGGEIKDFLNNAALGVTNRHRLVVALGAFPNARGRGNVVRLANSCGTGDQASFLNGALALLIGRQKATGESYVSLRVVGRILSADLASGETVIPAPVDHVSWTEEVSTFAKRDDLGSETKILLHTGSLTDLAARGFADAGWRLVPVPYPSL